MLEARLLAPDGAECEGGDGDHHGDVRTFVIRAVDKINWTIATWCDECAVFADMGGEYDLVAPLLRIDQYGIGVWKVEFDEWWGAPLTTRDMPDLNAEFFVPDGQGLNPVKLRELLAFLRGME